VIYIYKLLRVLLVDGRVLLVDGRVLLVDGRVLLADGRVLLADGRVWFIIKLDQTNKYFELKLFCL